MISKTLLTGLILTACFVVWAPAAKAIPVELSGPAGTEVFLNEVALGFLPMDSSLDLEPGTYSLHCELPGHQPYESTFRLLEGQNSYRVLIRLMELRQRTAIGSNLLFAGLGQHYAGQSLRGWIYNAVEASGLVVALAGELQRSNYRKDYLLLLDRYNQQINADQIAYYRDLSAAAYTDMEDAESLRNTGLMITGGVILVSLLDSLFLFPSLEVGAGSPVASNPNLGFEQPDSFRTVHVGYRTSF